MQYVTSIERRGIKKGLLKKSHEDIVDILRVRFELVPDTIVETINAINDLAVLKELLRAAVTVNSLDAFLAMVDREMAAV